MSARLPRFVPMGIAGALLLSGVLLWRVGERPATVLTGLAPPPDSPALRPRAIELADGQAALNAPLPTESAQGHSELLLAGRRAAANVADEDIPDYLARTDPATLAGETLRLLVARWAAVDPAAAVHWVATLPPSAERSELLQSAILPWARLDLDQALVWVRNTAASPERQSLALALGQAVVQRDPLISLLLAEDLAAPFAGELRECSLAAWAREAPVAAADFAARYLPPEEARRTLTRISAAQARHANTLPASAPVASANRGEALARQNFLAWLATQDPDVALRVANRLDASPPQ